MPSLVPQTSDHGGVQREALHWRVASHQDSGIAGAKSNGREHEKVTMKRVIIDTDPGIDDTAAIFLALASPELHVEALTTVYGNGTIADCTRNALVVLETAGRSDIPVYQGVSKPLIGAPNYAPHVHGSDALGD